MVKNILRQAKGKINVNAQDSHGLTPQHYAAGKYIYRGRRLVELLVEHGGDPELKSTTVY